MIHQHPIKLKSKKLAAFHKANPDFDILTFNFIDEKNADTLKITKAKKKETIEELKGWQRLLRMCPDQEAAEVLMSQQLDSARKITALSQSHFVKKVGRKLKGGNATARKIYKQAYDIKTKVMLLWTNISQLRKSPYYGSLAASPAPQDVLDNFQNLSSYQQIFGSLNYCSCPECKSILGPAAYLTDLLRLIDKAITKPNPSIPQGLTFNDRRPDIAEIKLTCANTNNLVPYLQIVNEILERTLMQALGVDDIYFDLVTRYYPFNLPFNLPLEQLRTYLAQENTSLSAIFTSMDTGASTLAIAREYLDISIEELSNYKKPAAASLPAVLTANYGLPITQQDLQHLNEVDTFIKQVGIPLEDLKTLLSEDLNIAEIFNAGGTYTVTGMKGNTLVFTQAGSNLTGICDYTTGKVVIDGSLIDQTMQGEWVQTEGGAVTQDYCQFVFADNALSFTANWNTGMGKPWESTTWAGTRDITVSPAASGIIPHSFFINTPFTDPTTFLFIRQNKVDPNNVFDEIANQDINTLDTLNRFIRLSQKLEWDYESVNWMLMTISYINQADREITDATIIELAKVMKLHREYALPLDLLASLWYDIQTIGIGNGQFSQAPFDQVFNGPQQVGFTDINPYHPKYPDNYQRFVNPLYQSDVVDWYLNDTDSAKSAPGNIIVSGIPVPTDSLRLIAAATFGNADSISLDVANLSVLYRHAVLVKALNIQVSEYILLLQQLKLTQSGHDTLIALSLTPDNVISIVENLKWMRQTGLNAFSVNYLCNAQTSQYAPTGYEPGNIPDFINSLHTTLVRNLLLETSFSGNGISPKQSQAVFSWMKDPQQAYADNTGFVSNTKVLTIDDLPDTLPVQGEDDFTLNFSIKNIIVHTTDTYRTNQKNAFISAMASFFQVKADYMAAVIAQTEVLFNNMNFLPYFFLFNLFSTPADSVLVKDSTTMMDPDKVRAVFARNSLALPETFLVSNTGTGTWIIQDSSMVTIYCAYQFSSGSDIYFYADPAQGPANVLLFDYNFIQALSRFLILYQTLELNIVQIAGVTQTPAAYNLTYTFNAATFQLLFPADNIIALDTFMEQESDFGDRNNALVAYLYSVQTATGDSCPELCAITGWHEDQCRYLCDYFFGKDVNCKTVSQIEKLNIAFHITAILGIDVYFLKQLNDIASWQDTDLDHWNNYKRLASTLLQNIKAVTAVDAWPTVFKSLNSTLEEDKRTAMLNLTVWETGKKYPDITTADNLYEYLLIDVNQGGCADISYIKQALNSAQLYLQRCRLNLERNAVIDKADLPDVFWEWIMNYRVWEANRQVFLYPENYLDPSLRVSKTDLFKELENNLSQGNINKATVEAAYINYLDSFQELATLQYVGGYHCYTEGPDHEQSEILYLFARTQSVPYQYYYITRQPGDVWSQWNKINITINADNIAAVYAFNKLFIFWVELVQTNESGTDNTKVSVTKATIKTSFFDYSGNWKQPQTIIDGQVVDVTPYPDFNSPFNAPIFNSNKPYFDRVIAFPATSDDFLKADSDPHKQEKIYLYYGPLADVLSYNPAKTPTPDPNAQPLTYAFEKQIAIDDTVMKQGVTMGTAGCYPLMPFIVIDALLEPSFLLNNNEYVFLQDDNMSDNSAPGFAASVVEQKLVLQSSANTMKVNYTEGMGLDLISFLQPYPATSDSFITRDISAAQSANIFTILTTPPNNVIGSNGMVTAQALTISIDMYAMVLSLPTFQAREVRNILFEHYYGTPSLLENIATYNSQIIPISNNPGMFIFYNNGNGYLFKNEQYGDINDLTKISTLLTAVNKYSFITLDIGQDVSANIYKALSTPPNNIIGTNGVVDIPAALNAQTTMIALLCSISIEQANEVKNILVSSSLTGISYMSGNYVYVTPSSFVTGDINEATSERVYKVLSTPPNKLISNNGIVDIGLASRVTPDMIAALTGLSTAQGTEILDILLTPDQDSVPGKFTEDDNIYTLHFKVDRLSTGAIRKLSSILFTEGIDQMLALSSQQAPENVDAYFDQMEPTDQVEAPDIQFEDQVNFKGPYGEYYWELFFHGPMLVSKVLNNNLQFRDAESWMQYIFNPTANMDTLGPDSFVVQNISPTLSEHIFTTLTTPPNDLINKNGMVQKSALTISPEMLASVLTVSILQAIEVKNILVNNYLISPLYSYWQFQPFREHTLQPLSEQLTDPAQIYAYNMHPLDPHAIARLRIGAYEKATVMQYIENLINWGDSEYRLYTWESITAALMLYIYAYDLLGPRPVDMGEQPPEFPVNFNEILSKYGDTTGGIPQFLIDMENAISSSLPPVLPPTGKDVPYNDIEAYFCIPENDTFTTYWDVIDNRLYNIRHCLNIDGVPQPLPLFDPPLNPMDLVKAAASGNNILNLTSLVQPNVPAYRFSSMLELSKSLTNTLTELGNELLSALEKKDAQGLQLLQAVNEINILNLTTQIKQQQIIDAQAQLGAMQENLQGAQYRQQYYAGLLAAGLNSYEIADIALRTSAIIPQGIAIGINGVSIAAYLAPNIFGLADGGMEFGNAVMAGASISSITAEILNQNAGIVATAGNYARRIEDWEFQKTNAEYEIAQLSEQITSYQARIAIAQQDLIINQKSIDQQQTVDTYLKNQFTNQDLYQWMISRLSSLFFQTYNLALNAALQTQAAYQFELNTSNQLITFNYWDNLYKGLLAGESLMLSLQQMETSFTYGNTRTFEIEKTISVLQNFPEAFLQFKWGNNGGTQGVLDFVLSEQLFDFDYPGQYCRKIKSISVSIPAVIGPYQNLNATLTQNYNWVIQLPDLDAVKFVISKTTPGSGLSPKEPGSDVLRQNWVPGQAIALSKGVDDSGLFTLNFDDERYLPFEGSGAISAWTLNLPPDTNRINFNSISDIIITVRYTAKNGGSNFANQVKGVYKSMQTPSGNYTKAKTFDLAQAFYSNWVKLFAAPVNGIQEITFPLTDNYWLTNLANVKVDKLAVQLEVAAGTAISGASFLQLKTDKGVKLISINSNYGELTAQDLTSIGFGTTSTACTLQFIDASLPDDISKGSGADKSLDETRLIDMAVVIYYTEAPFS
ncbi:neuraminidase-like domain-containing protein [Chitinophaga solisilvae]|uniref:Tc toxin subunit A-related protein n=1 Tax=Chitinophaga solisilvae TaxID=1233460 RepID=UPI00136C7F21|nr:neuraminidase-like domain-containing protein [Chitinophaga solisilvae]